MDCLIAATMVETSDCSVFNSPFNEAIVLGQKNGKNRNKQSGCISRYYNSSINFLKISC